MRTDNDTWDITTSVGSTALFVAAARALEAQKPDPLAVDPFAEVFCRAVGGPWAAVLDGEAPDHPLKSEEFGQHFVTFQAARTRYFDTYFGYVAQAGVRQVVILAAGLDSRAYRLDWAPDTTIYELDQPQVLDFKREALAAHGACAKAERREIAVDLRDDWPQALRDNGFRADEPSAWIAEGLLIYLPAAAQEQLFSGIDGLASSRSHLAVEEGRPMDRDALRAKVQENKGIDDPRGQWWQLVYNEQHAPASQWFGERGWMTEDTTLLDYLASVGRSVDSADDEAANMLASITLVNAVKE
ncbi:class I SAM-dependent methyltransferase [Mycobacterium crocinum]|uniref:S-adenosyl-L-methionine-dependent methyltransferase n=1 Tax=Mycolicibacterium crocinum TaxID=388459 RepID=A0ABY3TSX9_9MYCO|nr:class I SAM-dependent methyltransferase [Mycolicibacterium crocinum]MCV7214980.1 class I SAM-dependent methyltransferase [Mycolicibacterium crocinum]ULN42047.1 class I SAM-dependent methyltransferase [Mycolicibacterium crocinum]